MFADGSDFDRIFETADGVIRVLAEVHTNGPDLILDEIVIYGKETGTENSPKPGTDELLKIIRAVRRLAREAGFDRMIGTWHRIGPDRDERITVHTRSLL